MGSFTKRNRVRLTKMLWITWRSWDTPAVLLGNQADTYAGAQALAIQGML